MSVHYHPAGGVDHRVGGGGVPFAGGRQARVDVRRAFRHQAFDISELSLSSYCVSLTRDDPPYVAVPVFLSRAFRHSSVYIRSDRGIESPTDLRGRRIGIAEYQLTANVWVRAILSGLGKVKLTSVLVNGRDLFRVRVGPLANVADADQILNRVVAAGYPDARIIID